jgi:outer membrane protein OmpA-like peptidoglycan-associated protein
MKYLLFIILLFPVVAFCQPAYTSTNKSAVKNYEAATKYYDSYKNSEARAELEKAIKKDPAFIEAYILLANVLIDLRDYEGAIEQYKTALSVNPNYFPNNYYTLGNIELNIGRYADAKAHYEKFITFKGINEHFRQNAVNRIASAAFAMEAIKNPVPFDPENLGKNINSEFDEYIPSITVDSKAMFYTRLVPAGGSPGNFQEDFYISQSDKNEWLPSENAGAVLNTPGNEGVPNISFDGKLLFFAACDRKDGKGSCDIYYSRMKKEGWTRPINLGSPINTGAWESQPSFASDGRTLYFVRGTLSREEGKEQDIYSSRIGDDGKWSDPVKLNSNINTPDEEEFVFIHPDNQTLYFSSDGQPGLGKLDIFVSRREADGNWGPPHNLGYPINSVKDERGLVVGPKGTTAYISSNREGGFGGHDIYSFELYSDVRPLLVSYVKGVVTDNKTGNKLEAAYEIIDLATGKTVINSYSDKTSGEFLACLTAGKDYSLNVSKNGYLFYSDHFSCKNPADIKNAFIIDVKLEPAATGAKVVLKNVFFDTNLYNLKNESFSELDKLVAFMKNSPGISVQVSGHTDSTGDKKKNLLLSDNRAKSVYDYLILKGIEAGRLSYKGFGDSKPVADNATEEGRALNRRTEFIITAINN